MIGVVGIFPWGCPLSIPEIYSISRNYTQVTFQFFVDNTFAIDKKGCAPPSMRTPFLVEAKKKLACPALH